MEHILLDIMPRHETSYGPSHRTFGCTHAYASSLGRWLKVIDTQLTEDKIMATKIKRDEQSLRIVKETWGPILQQYSDLPNNWVHHREVLVGRSPRLA